MTCLEKIYNTRKKMANRCQKMFVSRSNMYTLKQDPAFRISYRLKDVCQHVGNKPFLYTIVGEFKFIEFSGGKFVTYQKVFKMSIANALKCH